MASTYKTPGAYVEEITKFPPSVAAVETAIPAFIGYTEKAEKNGESLKNIPTKIDSFLEFEQFFGGPPPRGVIVRLNAANQYVRTERNGTTYLLYDSLRLFYDNGGGICYIVSVGDYTKPPEIGDNNKGLLGGLKTLEKYDEPTLIVSPDATTLGTGLYTFQQQAINQCNKLQDRFLIGDLLKNDEKVVGLTHEDCVADFRNNIGINFLKYAAAYTPWLRTSIPAGLKFRDIIFAVEGVPSPTPASSLALLSSLTNSPAILQLLFDLNNSIQAVNALKANIKPGGAGSLVDANIADLEAQLKSLLNLYIKDYNDPSKGTFALMNPALLPIYAKIIDILKAIQVIYDSLPTVVAALLAPSATQTVEFKLKTDIDKLKDSYKGVVSALATHHAEHGQKAGAATLLAPGPKLNDVLTFGGFANLAAVPKDVNVQVLYRTLTVKKEMLDRVKAIANALPPATTAAVTATTVSASIPPPADLKTKIDTELATTTAALVGPADKVSDLIAALNGKIAAAVDMDKVIITIVKKYVEEEVALSIVAAGDLATAVTPFPTAMIAPLNQALLEAKQAANLAAGQPAATKTTVVNALDFPVVFPKEYTLIASGASAQAGGTANNLYNSILKSADFYETTFDQSLMQSFGIYKTLVARAGQDLMILPPSGGVAGVYASVDSNRGVWKAPANASLASVLGPYFIISTQEQEYLNVDANAGKSINAIRSFTGKGTLVWGTRTLAGNDNEWRYVPVRRFFNYAEESIKKATEPFVFEPNDLNTWVRVKAMIENFLTLEWRRGALAGAKATDAFFVKVGLGETMTALDILEGRMIVEIGLAVVRPAEFIILRFSHKMQES